MRRLTLAHTGALALAASLSGCRCGDPSASGPPPPPTASEAPAESATARPELRVIGASHILVAFKGAELASKAVTRSKEEARARAAEALAKLKEGQAPFEALAQQYSDDENKVVGGAIGNFERSAMPPAFADAAFALEIGETTDLVETARGFHIIRRTR
jgi:hypothetical protein